MEVDEMQANILVYDVGSTYTKAAAFALKDRRFTFLGRGQSPTTLHTLWKARAEPRRLSKPRVCNLLRR